MDQNINIAVLKMKLIPSAKSGQHCVMTWGAWLQNGYVHFKLPVQVPHKHTSRVWSHHWYHV